MAGYAIEILEYKQLVNFREASAVYNFWDMTNFHISPSTSRKDIKTGLHFLPVCSPTSM